MALVTGEELATALDLDYDPPEEPYDQVAAAADDIVASLLTDGAYELEPPACKEAALSVAVEIYQARTAAGSALSQTSSPKRQTSAVAASAAGRTLLDPRASRAEGSAVASTLSQRTVRSSARTGSVTRGAVKSAVKAVMRAKSKAV